MRALTVIMALSVACLASPAMAQEGHPLKGSWLGTWSPNKAHGNEVLIVLNWDGKAITGMINPGTDNIPIKAATLNPDGWQVHIEAEGKAPSGTVLNYVIDGKIENLALPNRSVVGTWRNQNEKGAFKISRQ